MARKLLEVRVQYAKLDTALLGEVDVVNPLHAVHQLLGQHLLPVSIFATDLHEEGSQHLSRGAVRSLDVCGRQKQVLGGEAHVLHLAWSTHDHHGTPAKVLGALFVEISGYNQHGKEVLSKQPPGGPRWRGGPG